MATTGTIDRVQERHGARPWSGTRQRALRVPPYSLCWLALAISVSVYVVLSFAVVHQPLVIDGHPKFFDLRVYRAGVTAMVEHRLLYAHAVYRGFWFTYPPFAALVLWPVSVLPLAVTKLAVGAANIFGVLWIMQRALLLEGATRLQLTGAQRWGLAALAAAAGLWLEPIAEALGFGQIDVLIAVLVLFDLSRPAGSRGAGVAIGLATAIKLTPAIFIVYLAFSGRWRAALRACLTLLATIAAAYIAVPADARAYWGGGIFLSSKHIGGGASAVQESLRGLVIKLGTTPQSDLWLAAAIPVGMLGLALAVRAARRGDEAAGYGLCAITALLCSPISWAHHWTLAMPALMLLLLRGWERRSLGLLAGGGALALMFYAYIPEITNGAHEHFGIALLWGDPYVIAALIVLAVAAGRESRGRAARSGWQNRPGADPPQ